MTSRDDAYARPKPQPKKLTPEQLAFRASMVSLTSHPGWPEFLTWLRDREWTRPPSAEAGALLVSEGRRSLVRELERFAESMSDRGDGKRDDGERG